MANPKRETPATTDNADSTEWEDVRIGIGEEWDFESNGGEPLVGNFLGSSVQQLTDKRTGEERATLVHQFAPDAEQDSVVFLWGSANLDKAMEQIEQGSRVRVSFLGRDQFVKDGEPRQVKRYRVQVAR